MAIKLYQFCISHYCEKARWALDYKGINYQTVNLLPGQHVNTIRKLTGAAGLGSRVPNVPLRGSPEQRQHVIFVDGHDVRLFGDKARVIGMPGSRDSVVTMRPHVPNDLFRVVLGEEVGRR